MNTFVSKQGQCFRKVVKHRYIFNTHKKVDHFEVCGTVFFKLLIPKLFPV